MISTNQMCQIQQQMNPYNGFNSLRDDRIRQNADELANKKFSSISMNSQFVPADFAYSGERTLAESVLRNLNKSLTPSSIDEPNINDLQAITETFKALPAGRTNRLLPISTKEEARKYHEDKHKKEMEEKKSKLFQQVKNKKKLLASNVLASSDTDMKLLFNMKNIE